MNRLGGKWFFDELRRRRVFRTVLLYVAGAWLALQVAELAFPALDIPSTAIRYVWLGAILLFPLVLVFGWRYDVGAKGISRTLPDDASGESAESLRRVDSWVIGGLTSVSLAIIAAMGVLIARFDAPLEERPPNSIAVLPFEVCEGQAIDAFLAGGLTGDVITRLAERERLSVIGRNTVYAMADAGQSIVRMADLLRVEHVLSGVVCRDGLDLTLNAEMTDANGYVIWQGSYRQDANDRDEIEHQVAAMVAHSVALELGDVTSSPAETPVNRLALEQLLIGQHHREQGDDEQARAAFEKALEYQPDYAEALFELALVARASGDSVVAGMEEAWPIGARALELANAQIDSGVADFKAYWIAADILATMATWEQGLAWRHAGELSEQEIALRKASAREKLEQAEQHIRKAIQLNPTEPELRLWLSVNLDRQGGEKRREALEILEHGRLLNPFDAEFSAALARRLSLWGQYYRAMEEVERFKALGEIPRRLRFTQLEIQLENGAVDERLAVLVDMLRHEPDKFAQGSGMLMHLYWIASYVYSIGLQDEADALHERFLAMPDNRDRSNWARQFFLLDKYREHTGHMEEVASENLAEVEGMTNAEILDGWYLRAQIFASAFWFVGERERAIELYESLQHFRHSVFWAARDAQIPMALAGMYMQVGRADDAIPVLEEVTGMLEKELAVGIRHPAVLADLASAYAWQGHDEKALATLAMAADHGWWWSAVADPYELILGDPWRKLRADTRFQKLQNRMRADIDQQKANIRLLLNDHDMNALLASVASHWEKQRLAQQDE
jgi:TolB-like protein/Flp pilus assembly protein TadD